MKTIVLSGSPLALPALQYLMEAGQLSALICPEDNTAGDTSQLQTWAAGAGVPFWSIQQETLEDELTELVTETRPDLALVYGFPHSLPLSALEGLCHGCWNVHFSLQPGNQGSIFIHELIKETAQQPVLQRTLALSTHAEEGSPLQQLSFQTVELLREGLTRICKESYIRRYFGERA